MAHRLRGVLLPGPGEPNHAQLSAAQLKTMQEVITLLVFSVFSVLYLKEPLKWNYLVGYGFIVGAVVMVFKKW